MSDSRRHTRDVMAASIELEAMAIEKGSTNMPPSQRLKPPEEQTTRTLPVAFDFKVPIVWMLGGAIFVGAGLIGMYYQLAALSEKVSDLQTSVKVNNATTIQFATEQALMKYRIEKLEHDARPDRR